MRVPRIRDDLTTSGLLTMEFVEGRSLREAIELTKRGRRDELDVLFPGVDMKAVIRTVARESLGQTLIHGLFQADPHPGNILIAPDGAVVYLDFGMFGVLSPLQRLNCLGYIENAAMGEAERSFEYFFKLIITTPDLNRIEFKRDMVVLMRTWAEWSADDGGRFSDRHLGTIMMKTLSTMRVNGTRLDTDMLLFWRVLFVLDSVALDLAEHVDLIEVMQEFFIEHASPVRRRFDLLAESAVPDLILHRRSIGRTGTCLRAPDGGTGRRPVATLKPRPSRRVGRERSFLVVASLVLTAAAVLLRG